jgi:hypothetical protein
MVDFRKALDYTNLTDLGFEEPKFTWLNMQNSSKFIKERLDKALGNSKWLDFFQVVKVNVLAACTLDHVPLLITFQHLVQQRPPRRFWYDARWGKILAYKEVIKKEWRPKAIQPATWHDVVGRLNSSKNVLLQCSHAHKCPTESTITENTKILRSLQEAEGVPDLNIVRELQSEVASMEEQQDIKWRQLAKEHWLKNGDQNTSYYHACVKQRRRANHISNIINEGGVERATPELIEEAFVNYFRNTFATSNPHGTEECLANFTSRSNEFTTS